MEEFSKLYSIFVDIESSCYKHRSIIDGGNYQYYCNDQGYKCIFNTENLKTGVEYGDKAIIQHLDSSIGLYWLENPKAPSIRISQCLGKLVISQSHNKTETDYDAGQIQELLDDQEFWFYLVLSENIKFS